MNKLIDRLNMVDEANVRLNIKKTQPHIIKLLDKEWYFLIISIKNMESDNAFVMLNEMYKHIPMLFGFPHKVMDEFGEFNVNKDWTAAKDWIDYHAGWEIDKDGNFDCHHITKLKDRFHLNRDLWDKDKKICNKCFENVQGFYKYCCYCGKKVNENGKD